MSQSMQKTLNTLLEPITQSIEQARGQVRQEVNGAMVQRDWHIGVMIGLAFVERQQRTRFTDEVLFKVRRCIEWAFYNFKLKCVLLMDLKLGKLKHQDIGQMDTYVRLYDEQHKGSDDNPAIGFLICSEKSESAVQYSVLTDQKQLFFAKYQLCLPPEEQPKHERKRAKATAQLVTKEHDNE